MKPTEPQKAINTRRPAVSSTLSEPLSANERALFWVSGGALLTLLLAGLLGAHIEASKKDKLKKQARIKKINKKTSTKNKDLITKAKFERIIKKYSSWYFTKRNIAVGVLLALGVGFSITLLILLVIVNNS